MEVLWAIMLLLVVGVGLWSMGMTCVNGGGVGGREFIAWRSHNLLSSVTLALFIRGTQTLHVREER